MTADFFINTWRRVADFIWPRVCAVEDCACPSDRPDRHLCSACFAALPFYDFPGTCRVCNSPVAAKTYHEFTCEECERHPPAFEFARSAVVYREPVDQLLLDFKFHNSVWLCEDLTDLLEGAVRSKLRFAEIDAVLPVPLHPKRERERGYNQSALLAESLARRLNRRFDARSLSRTRNTEHQARLSGKDRLKNLKDAFTVKDTRFVRGRTLLVIDDVMTTGATLSHCARALLQAGAARIWCATVSRALLRQ